MADEPQDPAADYLQSLIDKGGMSHDELVRAVQKFDDNHDSTTLQTFHELKGVAKGLGPGVWSAVRGTLYDLPKGVVTGAMDIWNGNPPQSGKELLDGIAALKNIPAQFMDATHEERGRMIGNALGGIAGAAITPVGLMKTPRPVARTIGGVLEEAGTRASPFSHIGGISQVTTGIATGHPGLIGTGVTTLAASPLARYAGRGIRLWGEKEPGFAAAEEARFGALANPPSTGNAVADGLAQELAESKLSRVDKDKLSKIRAAQQSQNKAANAEANLTAGRFLDDTKTPTTVSDVDKALQGMPPEAQRRIRAAIEGKTVVKQEAPVVPTVVPSARPPIKIVDPEAAKTPTPAPTTTPASVEAAVEAPTPAPGSRGGKVDVSSIASKSRREGSPVSWASAEDYALLQKAMPGVDLSRVKALSPQLADMLLELRKNRGSAYRINAGMDKASKLASDLDE